jgi:hypothetical protein
MNKNGKQIQNFLEEYQYEMSVGCEKYGHRYSKNGAISCINVCGL